MSHRTKDRDAEFLSRIRRGAAGTARNIRRSGPIDGCIEIMGPPRPEFHDRSAVRRLNDPARLGRNHRFVIEREQDRRFDKLHLDDLPSDPDQRFVREDWCSFRDRINISRETNGRKVIEKFRRKLVQTAKIFDIAF